MSEVDSSSGRLSKWADGSSMLLAVAVLTLSVPLQYLFPPGTEFLGLELGTVHNLIIVAATVPVLLTRGLRHSTNPVLTACALLLVISFTLSSRLPQLTALQSFKTFASLALGAYIFELRLGEKAWRILRAGLPWMALINLSIGAVATAVAGYSITRVDWGALRLMGLVVPGHLAYLALASLLFSLLGAERRPYWLLAIVNLAVITWTGSRTAMFGGVLLTVGWLAVQLSVARRAGKPYWTTSRAAIALAVPLALLSYAPFMANRFSSFHSNAAEGFEVHLPSGADEDDSWFSTYQGEDEDGEGLRISSTGRLKAWSFFWAVAQDNLWFGRGLGAGVVASRGQLHESFRVPHNEYLRLVVAAGIVGMVAFVIGYLVQGRQLVRRISTMEGRVMVVLALLVLAGDAVLRNPLTAQHFMIPLWLFFGLQIARSEASETRARGPMKSHPSR